MVVRRILDVILEEACHMGSQEILVIPRHSIEGYARFLPWHAINTIMCSMVKDATWIPRDQAEESRDWVQPIPCAYIHHPEFGYYTLTRINQGREDLRSKISLVFGGHIDKTAYYKSITSLASLFDRTLRRELEEELNLIPFPFRKIMPIGLIIDYSSVQTSRHIAFVYEISTKIHLKMQATEEFSSHAEDRRGFFRQPELVKFRKNFDPWSSILFEDYLMPHYRKKTCQLTFPFFSNTGSIPSS
jgi:predicted NUDIX family phosphoesterase